MGIVSFNNGIQLKQERFWVKSKAKKILSKRSLSSPKKRISQKKCFTNDFFILLPNTFSLTTLKTI
jgi:hypothetical protein